MSLESEGPLLETGLPDPDSLEIVRLRLDIAYDGTAFNGWSRQPVLRTVQGELEAALEVIFGRSATPPTLTVAGRTDAGVHATGQVAHIDLTPEHMKWLSRPRGKSGGLLDLPAALGRRINGLAGIDSDVIVTSACYASAGFDARFSANWRSYEFRVSDKDGPRNPLERHRTVWYPARLDIEQMNSAAELLVGLHDWATFCKPRELSTTVRSLEQFYWTHAADGVLVAVVRADAFCHSMVRALVGATIAVGEGKLTPARLIQLRDELDRSSDFNVMPAKGLTLVEVGYPEAAELAARAVHTRRRRQVPTPEAPGVTAQDNAAQDNAVQDNAAPGA